MLNAGFAAVGANDWQSARAHAAETQDVEQGHDRRLLAIRKRLQAMLDGETRRERERSLLQSYETGRRALQAGELEKAKEAFEKTLTFGDLFTPAERASVHISLSTVAARQGDSAEEFRQLSLAHELEDDPSYLMERARVRSRWDDREGAEADYVAAQRAGVSEKEAASIERQRFSLRPLPGSGWSAMVHGGSGIDTNAGQSGSADAIGVASSLANVVSPFVAASARIERSYRLDMNWALTPHYRGYWVGLTALAVQNQSIQEHQGAIEVSRALSLRDRLDMGLGASMTLVGLTDLSPFTFEPQIEVRWTHDSPWPRPVVDQEGPSLKTVLSARAARSRGLGGRSHLDGFIGEGRLTVGYAEPTLRGILWGSLLYYGIGKEVIDFPINELFHCAEGSPHPHCQTSAEGAGTYVIPLGYLAPEGGVRGTFDLSRHFQMSGSASVQWRRYLEESYAVPDRPPPGQGQEAADRLTEATKKRRRDLRTCLGAAVEWFPEVDRSFGVVLDYSFLHSRSNMARETPHDSPTTTFLEPNHDYDNRNFAQHIVELGFNAMVW